MFSWGEDSGGEGRCKKIAWHLLFQSADLLKPPDNGLGVLGNPIFATLLWTPLVWHCLWRCGLWSLDGFGRFLRLLLNDEGCDFCSGAAIFEVHVEWRVRFIADFYFKSTWN